MNKNNTAATEWKAFLKLRDTASRAQLTTVARAMKDASNRRAALAFLSPTATQRKQGAERFRTIMATSADECRRHCQFAGLPKL